MANHFQEPCAGFRLKSVLFQRRTFQKLDFLSEMGRSRFYPVFLAEHQAASSPRPLTGEGYFPLA